MFKTVHLYSKETHNTHTLQHASVVWSLKYVLAARNNKITGF